MSLNIVDLITVSLLTFGPLCTLACIFILYRYTALRTTTVFLLSLSIGFTALFIYLIAPTPNRLSILEIEVNRVIGQFLEVAIGAALAAVVVLLIFLLARQARQRSIRLYLFVSIIAMLFFFIPTLGALYIKTSGVSTITVEDNIPLEVYTRTGVRTPTALELGPDNELYVAGFTGTIWVVRDDDLDGEVDQVHEFAQNLQLPAGMAWGDDGLYVNEVGRVLFLKDTDGDDIADEQRVVFDQFPSIEEIHPHHQNHSIIYGEDGRLYIGSGSTSDSQPETHPYANGIFSMNTDGSDVRTFATGTRNPFSFVPAPGGGFFAVDNGASGCTYDPVTDTDDCSVQFDVPEEINYVTEGNDYGAPNYFGMPEPGSDTIPPLVTFREHTTPAGIEIYTGNLLPDSLQNQLFVTFWSANQIYRIRTFQIDSEHYVGDPYLFVSNIPTPTAIINSPYGGLYVASFTGNAVYHIG